MAEVVLHPDSQAFPPGTVVKVFLRDARAPLPKEGTPLGGEVEGPTVSAAGVLTVKGVTSEAHYIGYSRRGETDYYITFVVPPAASGGTGTSVAEVETLISEKAVSTVSPTFTGTPKAPTAAESTNNTQLATTAYADRAVGAEATLRTSADSTEKTARESGDSTEKSARETADALLLAKSDNLGSLANAGTARTNLGLGTAATTAASAYDVAGAAATAQTAAEAASQIRLSRHATVTTDTTLTVNQLTPIDASGAARKEKLPASVSGAIIQVEKNDTSANTVTLEGTIRTTESSTFVLTYVKETVVLVGDGTGWWPVARYIALSSIKEATRQINRRTLPIPVGQVPANEILIDEYVKIESGETRKILWVEAHTTSGTIKVAISRGEAGTTAISAYEALEATSSIKVTTSTQALADKDRLRVTTSSGSSPKGLFVTIGEEVVAP